MTVRVFQPLVPSSETCPHVTLDNRIRGVPLLPTSGTAGVMFLTPVLPDPLEPSDRRLGPGRQDQPQPHSPKGSSASERVHRTQVTPPGHSGTRETGGPQKLPTATNQDLKSEASRLTTIRWSGMPTRGDISRQTPQWAGT